MGPNGFIMLLAFILGEFQPELFILHSFAVSRGPLCMIMSSIRLASRAVWDYIGRCMQSQFSGSDRKDPRWKIVQNHCGFMPKSPLFDHVVAEQLF